MCEFEGNECRFSEEDKLVSEGYFFCAQRAGDEVREQALFNSSNWDIRSSRQKMGPDPVITE